MKGAKYVHLGESATHPVSPQPEKAMPGPSGYNTVANWKISIKETKESSDPQTVSNVDSAQVSKLGGVPKERKQRAVLRETKSFKLSSFSPQHDNPNPNRPPPAQSEKLKLPAIGGRSTESTSDTQNQALRRLNARYLNVAQSLARNPDPNLMATRQLLLDVLKELPTAAPEAAPLFRLMIELTQSLGHNKDRGRGKGLEEASPGEQNPTKQALKREVCAFFDATEPKKKLLLTKTKKRLSTSVEETPDNLPPPPIFEPSPPGDCVKLQKALSQTEMPNCSMGGAAPPRRPKPFIPRLDMEIVHKRAGSYF
jgi:hypothetical protein